MWGARRQIRPRTERNRTAKNRSSCMPARRRSRSSAAPPLASLRWGVRHPHRPGRIRPFLTGCADPNAHRTLAATPRPGTSTHWKRPRARRPAPPASRERALANVVSAAADCARRSFQAMGRVIQRLAVGTPAPRGHRRCSRRELSCDPDRSTRGALDGRPAVRTTGCLHRIPDRPPVRRRLPLARSDRSCDPIPARFPIIDQGAAGLLRGGRGPIARTETAAPERCRAGWTASRGVWSEQAIVSREIGLILRPGARQPLRGCNDRDRIVILDDLCTSPSFPRGLS